MDSQAVAAGVFAARPDPALVGLTIVPEPGFDAIETQRYFQDEHKHVAALAGMYPMRDNQLIESPDVALNHKLDAFFLVAGTAPRNVLNVPWLHAVHDRARLAGCDVLLKGSKGNLRFSFDGEGGLPSWLARGHWLRLARELWAGRGKTGLTHHAARDVLLPLPPRQVQAGLTWAGSRSAAKLASTRPRIRSEDAAR